jgi:hypothetical protein
VAAETIAAQAKTAPTTAARLAREPRLPLHMTGRGYRREGLAATVVRQLAGRRA